MVKPARGEYVCKVCTQVLRSPGALGGHMTWHRKRGQLHPFHTLTLTEDDGGWPFAACDCGWASPPVPDNEIAAECWADHKMTVAEMARAVMASPIYDVWIVRNDGTGEIFSKHVPPSKFFNAQAPGDWP